MTDRQALLIAVAYLLISVLTFGYAAGNARCEIASACQMDKAMSGLAGGMFWPLYWSWEIFE